MSNSREPLQAVKVVETLIDYKNSPVYSVLKGTQSKIYQKWTSTSVSSSSITFTTTTNSNTVVDKRMYIALPVRLTFTGSVSGSPTPTALLNVGRDAPRSWPISKNLASLTVAINGTSFTVNPYQMQSVFERLKTFKEDYTCFSGTPVYSDYSQNYSDLFGTNRDPLIGFGSQAGETVPRGGFPFKIISNTTTSAVVEMIVIEPINISPLLIGLREQPGFVNTQQINITFNFLNNGMRWWSHNGTITGGSGVTDISNVAVQFGGLTSTMWNGFTVPELYINYATPDASLEPIDPNKAYNYPYYQPFPYVSDQSNVPNNSTAELVSNNIMLTSVPRKMYVCVRPTDSALQSSTEYTDTFFSITGIKINFNNNAGILSNASPTQLYEMSVKNGIDMTKPMWSGDYVMGSGAFPVGAETYTGMYHTVGSIFAAEFGTDIPIQDPMMVPGGQCNTNLQITVSCKNISGFDVVPTVLIILVYEGVFTISSYGQSSSSITPLSAMDIQNAIQSPYVRYDQMEKLGGSIFSNLGNWILGALGSVIKNTPIVSEIAPLASKLVKGIAPGSKHFFDKLGLGYRGGVAVGGDVDYLGGDVDYLGGNVDYLGGVNVGGSKKKGRATRKKPAY